MEKTSAKVKRWGNSFGVILPKSLIENQKIREGMEIELVVKPLNKTKVEDIFGILKGKIKRSTADLLKEVDEDFGNNE